MTPCIMPEMPYCPACQFGYIERTPDMPDDTCIWVCLCTEEKYREFMEAKETT